MTTVIKPILENANIRTYQGRYDVQLEIPQGSTLSATDIDAVGNLASWNIDPNERAEGYEGGRSVLVSRQFPVNRHGLELRAMQISGIGYKPIDFSGEVSTIDLDNRFLPPSSKNFISLLKGTLMSTSCGINGKAVTTRPSYRALGTYISDELVAKINTTLRVSGFDMKNLVTPVLEAYGRYLTEDLKDKDGNFGFLVFSAPSVDSQRAAENINSHMKALMNENREVTIGEALETFFEYSLQYTLPLIKGLRELHDKQRVAHLQPHKSNYYMVNGIPYLMDWSTMANLGTNSLDNIINRTIDVTKPRFNFDAECRRFFGKALNTDQIEPIGLCFAEEVMNAYTGNKGNSMLEIVTFYSTRLGGNSREIDMVIAWMKDQGFEGFTKRTIPKTKPKPVSFSVNDTFEIRGNNSGFDTNQRNSTNKIGRNNKCPCGSGKKFKNCCLRR